MQSVSLLPTPWDKGMINENVIEGWKNEHMRTPYKLDLPNTTMIQVFYHLRLITADPDDDKFVDCAFKANAKYIVTQDHHYDVLRNTPFPHVDVLALDDFMALIK